MNSSRVWLTDYASTENGRLTRVPLKDDVGSTAIERLCRSRAMADDRRLSEKKGHGSGSAEHVSASNRLIGQRLDPRISAEHIVAIHHGHVIQTMWDLSDS